MSPTLDHPFRRYAELIDDWDQFTQCLAEPLPRSLWLNPSKPITSELTQSMTANWQKGSHSYICDQSDLGTHWAYHAGLYHVQEVVSMLPVILLAPQPGERILDLCAAPGSKTVQMALAMQNQGTLIANDKNYMRTKALRYHLERLGIVNVTTTTADGTSYPNSAGLFDKILVDAPCSGEGTSRKQSQNWLQNLNVHNVYKLQQRLLSRAVSLCKPGGLIVYSTCTYAPEENEQVVNFALQNHPELSLLPISFPDLRTAPGITTWQGQNFSEEVTKTARVWPHHNNTGGFYLALFRKSADADVAFTDTFVTDDGNACEELQQYLQPFDLPTEIWNRYAAFRVNKRGIYITSAGHSALAPKPDAIGLFVLKTYMEHPKLTTAGARLWGHLARQQFIELDNPQLQNYLQREDIPLAVAQADHCTRMGYVIVRHQGLGIGVGLLMNSLIPGEFRLRSLYPKI